MNSISFFSNLYPKFKDQHAILLFISIVAFFIILLSIKKGYLKYFKNQDYRIIPVMNINTVSSVSMVIAMNIALIITITLLSNKIVGIFFSIYPGIRFLIENILIKIGGILFGPIIGIFIALSTDLLTVIFTSSVLHYGYLFSAIMNGFMGGMIHILVREKNKNKKLKNVLIALGIKIFSLLVLCFVFVANSNNLGGLEIKFLSFSLNVYWIWLFSYISFLFLLSSFFLIMSSICAHLKDREEYINDFWVQKFASLNRFFNIVSINFSAFLLIDIISLPLFDIKISSLPYEQFIIFRIVTFLPLLLVSSSIIWYIFKQRKNIGLVDILKKSEIIKEEVKLSEETVELLPKKSDITKREKLKERLRPLCFH